MSFCQLLNVKHEFNPNQYIHWTMIIYIYYSVYCHYTPQWLVFYEKAEWTPILLGNTSTSMFESPIKSHTGVIKDDFDGLWESFFFVMVIDDSFPSFSYQPLFDAAAEGRMGCNSIAHSHTRVTQMLI